MNAPVSHDPATVTTRNGMQWTRRAVTVDGRGLYAPAGVCNCPERVMATLAELAEQGLQSQELAAAVAELGALPVPIGSIAPTTEQVETLAAVGNRALSDHYHERACACSDYPESCVTDTRYRAEFGFWDTGAFDIAMGAVIAAWEAMRITATAAKDSAPAHTFSPGPREDAYESPLARGPHPLPHDLPEVQL
ncbi:hypothetical protein [Streptomyces sp. NPDC096153]|uniref:hypothetical protein n=1 Tax=Streptomyces sp. NPDC096153 TaxID=3155548 RepID=UPI00331B1E7A